jgi:peptide/nickel transport system permease protein
LPGDPARMMLDQNENSEQLALIKRSMVLTNPLLPSIYIISMTSPFHHIAKNESDYTYLSEGKYNAAQLFFSN